MCAATPHWKSRFQFGVYGRPNHWVKRTTALSLTGQFPGVVLLTQFSTTHTHPCTLVLCCIFKQVDYPLVQSPLLMHQLLRAQLRCMSRASLSQSSTSFPPPAPTGCCAPHTPPDVTCLGHCTQQPRRARRDDAATSRWWV